MRLSKNSKRAKRFIELLEKSEDIFLHDVYERYSQAKAIAWNHCFNECKHDGGLHFRILSHNTFGFTCGWIAPYGYRIETPGNTYIIQA